MVLATTKIKLPGKSIYSFIFEKEFSEIALNNAKLRLRINVYGCMVQFQSNNDSTRTEINGFLIHQLPS